MTTNGAVKTRTMFSVIRMLKRLPFEWKFMTQTGCLIHENRRILVERAKEEGCTHILFIDSDMTFDEDALERLLERDKPIIGVDTNMRAIPLTSTVKRLDEKGNMIWEEFPDGLVKCAGVGSGFLLLELSVFDSIEKPWFFFETDETGKTLWGEDMWFCRKASKAGYNIWCDRTVKVGHIGDYEY